MCEQIREFDPSTTIAFFSASHANSQRKALACGAQGFVLKPDLEGPKKAVDTVSIQKADFVVSKKQFTVQASGTSQTATLTVKSTATGQVIGVLTNKGASSYVARSHKTFPSSDLAQALMSAEQVPILGCQRLNKIVIIFILDVHGPLNYFPSVSRQNHLQAK